MWSADTTYSRDAGEAPRWDTTPRGDTMPPRAGRGEIGSAEFANELPSMVLEIAVTIPCTSSHTCGVSNANCTCIRKESIHESRYEHTFSGRDLPLTINESVRLLMPTLTMFWSRCCCCCRIPNPFQTNRTLSSDRYSLPCFLCLQGYSEECWPCAVMPLWAA